VNRGTVMTVRHAEKRGEIRHEGRIRIFSSKLLVKVR